MTHGGVSVSSLTASTLNLRSLATGPPVLRQSSRPHVATEGVSENSVSLLSKPSEPEKNASKTQTVKLSKTVLTFQDLGVWTIMTEVNQMASWMLPGRAIVVQAKEMIALLPILYLFLQECFSVSPQLMVAYLLSSVWASTEVRIAIRSVPT